MVTHEILDNLYFIERGYLNGNHFVYRSPDPILIDTGYVADFKETAGSIMELGLGLSDIRLIVNTHCHCDHVGGNRIIQKESGCDIAMHKIGKHFIDTRDDWATWWRYYHQEASFFECTQTLEDGQIIALGAHRFQVIHTPGHSCDGIVLYNKEDGVLISSDTLWEKDMAVMTIRVEGSAALFHMQESLEKLASLDVKVVFPGHGKPFTDLQSAISGSRKRIRRYMQNSSALGIDLLKKILVYTLLMKRSMPKKAFFPHLMGTHWFKETIELYFDGEYQAVYDQILESFLQRGIFRQKNGNLFTTIKP